MSATKVVMSVCPHDTAGQLERWFVFAQQLSLVAKVSVRLTPALDFPDFYQMFDELDLVYANPNDALQLVQEREFIPLARMEGRFDEAVIVARRGDPLELAVLRERRVATCKAMIITDVGLRHLAKQGLASGELVDHTSWGAALAALLHEKTDAAILYRDFYEGLRPETQEKLKVLATTDEAVAFHAFLLAPKKAEWAEALRSALLSLHETPGGKDALLSLGAPHLVAAEKEHILSFAAIHGA